MSYSFQVRAATKDEALTAVREKLLEVAKGQPIHEKDIDAAYETAAAFVKLLNDDPDKDVQVTVQGSLSWAGQDTIIGGNVSVAVSLWPRS